MKKTKTASKKMKTVSKHAKGDTPSRLIDAKIKDLGDWRGETLARVSNVFGDVIAEYVSPIDGIVVGRSVNPIYQTGARVVHIGRPATHAQLERWGVSELL